MSEVRAILNTIVNAHDQLRQLGVIRSQRFVADYGEWLVETIFRGVRSTNKIEKHWDVIVLTP